MFDLGAHTHSWRNQFLSSLPETDRSNIRSHLRRVRVGAGEVLHEAGNPIKDVYFPESGLVSILADVGDDEQVEVVKIGSEGVIGIWAIMPEPLPSQCAKVQVTGSAMRLPAEVLRSAFEESAVWREHCLRYANMLMSETAQIAACNARHTLSARLARWLLEARDKVGQDVLPLTHSMVSLMLGVRRAGVTTAVGQLQAKDLIRCGRGQITITDGAGLEAVACSCYRIAGDKRMSFEASELAAAETPGYAGRTNGGDPSYSPPAPA